MTGLANVSVGKRLGGAFLVVCVLLVAVAATGVWGIRRNSQLEAELTRLVALSDQMKQLRYLDENISSWQGYVYSQSVVDGPAVALAPDGDARTAVTAAQKEAYALLDRLDLGAMTPAEATEARRQRGLWDKYFAEDALMRAELAKNTKASFAQAYQLLWNDLDKAWSDLVDSTEKVIASIGKRVKALTEQVKGIGSVVTTTVLVAAGFALVLAALLARWATRSVVRPLRRSVDVLGQITAGDLTATTGLTSDDELGRLGRAVDDMTTALRGTVEALAGSADAVTLASQDLSATSDRIAAGAADAAEQATVVSDTAADVARNVDTVSAGSGQMERAIRDIAGSATTAARVAGEAVTVAGETTAVVAQLGASSAEIGDVVRVITKIAEQTNLLALNATIEAARAGAAGAGFAVVATEVKDLSRETARATADIAERIQAIQVDTTAAAEAIERITAVVAEINDHQTSIAAAVEEQSVTSREMSRNVGEAAHGTTGIATAARTVAGSTSDTTAGVAEARRAAADLARISADMRDLVRRFRH